MLKLLGCLIIVFLTLMVVIIEPKMHKPAVFGSKPILSETHEFVAKTQPVKIKPQQNTEIIREEYMKPIKMRSKQQKKDIYVEPVEIPQVSRPVKIKQEEQVREPVINASIQKDISSSNDTSEAIRQLNEVISWNKWRANLCNTISENSLENQVDRLQKGVVFKYFFYVDNKKRITNINVSVTRGKSNAVVQESVLDIKNTIKSLEGKDILTFPEGSRRTKVRVDGGIETAGYNASVSPSIFSDIEFH